MNKSNNKKTKLRVKSYTAFTLMEMIVTLAIMAIVFLLISATFMAIVKASIISNSLMSTRDEADLALRVIENSVKQSDPEYVMIYNSSGVRTYTASTFRVNNTGSPTDIATVYGTKVAMGSQAGNEIHMLPQGSDRWICIGYFIDPSTNHGYLLKTSSKAIATPADHDNCFDPSFDDYKKNTIQLTTDGFNIVDDPAVPDDGLRMSYFYGDNENTIYFLEVTAAPYRWFGDTKPLQIVRQSVVTTRKLTSVF
jgi:prepilin-type N-terminal cleavage/methylation domain-containing protein